MNNRLSIIFIFTIFLTSCVAQWKGVTPENNAITQNGLNLVLPKGWVTLQINKKLQITSFDGPSLNQIVLETIAVKDIEKRLKITIPDGMDSLDASKQFIAYWSSVNDISEFTIVSNNFVETNNYPYYLIEWTFKDDNGLTIRNVSKGFSKNGLITHISYSAPNIHYFEKSHSVYQQICNNLTQI